MSYRSTELVAIVSRKGGVGKTVLTGQLAGTRAMAFSSNQDRGEAQILAVSTDPQQSLTDWLAKVEKVRAQDGQPMLIDYTQEHHNPRVLARLKTARQYRTIFIDTPGWYQSGDSNADGLDQRGADNGEPQEKQILLASLEETDLVCVPLPPEDMAFKPTKQTIEEILVPLGKKFVVVINNWDPRDGTGDLNDTRRRVERQGWPLANTVIRRYKLHTSASATGRLCTDYPRSRTAEEARRDFLELNLELAAMWGRG